MPAENEVSPAIGGTVYYKLVDAPTPVLSLVWQRLRPGTNLGDQTRRISRVWNTTLDYLARLPGCERILWGHCIGTAEPEILLLIRWRSVAGWVAFQRSPGLRMLYIADLGRGNPLNITICLGLGDWGDWDTTAIGKVAEISLFTLDDKVPAATTTRSAEDLVALGLLSQIPEVEAGCLRSYTAVVERYASGNPSSASGREEADSLPDTLARMSVWDAANYPAAALAATEAPAYIRFVAQLELPAPIPAMVLTTGLSLPSEYHNSPGLADLVFIPLSRQRAQSVAPNGDVRCMGNMHGFSEPAWGEPYIPKRSGHYCWQLFRFTTSHGLHDRVATTATGDLPADIAGLAAPVASLRRELKDYKDYMAVQLCRVNSASNACTFELLICTSLSLLLSVLRSPRSCITPCMRPYPPDQT